MKGMGDLFCKSEAATAIRLRNMDNENDPSLSSSSATIQLGGGGSSSGRAIDRFNPIIRDPRRLGRSISHHPIIPSSCTSQSRPEVISPIPLLQSHQDYQSIKKGGSEPKKEKSDNNNNNNDNHSVDHNKKKKKKAKPLTQILHEDKRRSSSGANKIVLDDLPNRNDGSTTSFGRKSWSFNNNTASPVGSSRYLLSSDQNQTAFINVISDFDTVLELEAEEPFKPHPPPAVPAAVPKHESSSAPISRSSSSDQVVVLRVSLHCRGCERKMRKHISRMEGVSSFDIDFAAKRLTVVGNVTPLGVLASVSKVKNAQLLTPPAAVPQPSSSEINKNSHHQVVPPPPTTATVSS